MQIELRSLIGIFTIIDGKINLLMDNNNLLTIKCEDEIEVENSIYINNNLNIDNLDLKQCYTFTEKENNKIIISILHIDIVNYKYIKLNKFNLVPIDDIEKNVYIKKLIEYLKKYLVLNSTIKRLYPDEFILPEVQKVYEDLLEKKYDRRNFRKKLIKLDVIEDLDKISENKKGRPAKLYRFKNTTEERILI